MDEPLEPTEGEELELGWQQLLNESVARHEAFIAQNNRLQQAIVAGNAREAIKEMRANAFAALGIAPPENADDEFDGPPAG